MLNKICNSCDKEKPIAEYHNNSAGLYGKSQRCKVCVCKEAKEYRTLNHNKVYASKYKTDESTIAEILGRVICDICQAPPTGQKRHAIDHCHTTGKVRGLLCWSCNKGLGNFKDNVALFDKAKIYIQNGTN